MTEEIQVEGQDNEIKAAKEVLNANGFRIVRPSFGPNRKQRRIMDAKIVRIRRRMKQRGYDPDDEKSVDAYQNKYPHDEGQRLRKGQYI